ncbi:MAG: TonB family protein [Burkholderiales bacterium]|nr:TonB family protein [Burkholderiales bacterium]
MNALAAISFRRSALAWAPAFEDEARFKRISSTVVLLCLAFGGVLPWLPHPVAERHRVELPPPLAKLLLEHEPPRAVLKPAPATASSQRQMDVDTPAERSTRAVVPEARRPQPNKPAGEMDNARRRASGIGLLAMKSQLAEIHGAPSAVQLQDTIKPGPGVGSGAGVGVGAGADPGLPVRAMITAGAAQGSGGINTAAYSRNTGGGGLAGRATTLVAGVAGGGGGGGPGGGGVGVPGARGDGSGLGAGAGKGGSVQRSGSGKASRSIEDIKLVFDRNKGAIYALYNRALRDEPGLQGKVVLELKIAPSGEVADIRLVASELHAAELERKLLARVRQFDFGPKDVETMVVSWPVDFLPS